MKPIKKYGIYLAAALTIIAVEGPPLLLLPIALLAVLTWKEK